MRRPGGWYIVSARFLLAVCVLLGAASTPSAGIFETHHDINWMTGRSGERSPCSHCHIPGRLFSDRSPFAADRIGGYTTSLDRLGAFCFSCHDGTVNPDGLIESPDGTIGVAVLAESHGYNVQRIMEATGGLETWRNVDSSGLVPPDPATDMMLENFSCSACHDVHSDRYAPFLQVPLDDLCGKCHSGSDGLGRGRWTALQDVGEKNGPHPVGMTLGESLTDLVRGSEPEKSFHEPFALFRVPAASPDELRSPTVHWQTGGHLSRMDGAVTCSTCHSAHMTAEGLLLASAAEDYEKTVCAGCHTDGSNFANPGMTPYYHPVFEESLPPYVHDHSTHPDWEESPKTGTWDLYVKIPKEFPFAEDGSLTCRTCHRAHQGKAGERCQRVGPLGWGVICNECHGTRPADELPTANMHHPTGDTDYTSWGFAPETAWSWGKGLPGDLTDGLQCVDCHIEWAKSAHNWR